MSKIQNFSHPQFGSVRIVVNNNGDLMFVANDVAKILNYSNPRDAVAKHCKSDGVAKCDIMDNLGRNQSMSVLNEPNFYRLVMRSDMPDAEKFQDWVCEDVLTSIRKHGAYMTPQTIENVINDPDFGIKLLSTLKEERIKRVEAEKQVLKLKPKAELMDKVLDSGEKIDIGQAAKILNLPYGRNRLFKKLRELGILFKGRNEPKQEYIDKKYFELKEKWVDRNEHEGFAVIKILVTQKGLEFLNDILSGDKTSANMAKIA